MEFAKYLIQTPEFVSWMAFSAFLFSFLSLLWTRRAVNISQATLDESKINNQRIENSEIEQKRHELLKAITSEREMIQNILATIGALKADYDASSELVKKLMGDRAKIFSDFMPIMESYKVNVESRHTGATNWKIETGVPELMQMLNEQDVAAKNTSYAITCNQSVINEFREKLEQASNLHQPLSTN